MVLSTGSNRICEPSASFLGELAGHLMGQARVRALAVKSAPAVARVSDGFLCFSSLGLSRLNYILVLVYEKHSFSLSMRTR